jgi:UrcA family protein
MSTSLRMKQSTAWLALVTLASAAASANPHDTEETVRSEKVNFADLNTSTLAGVNVLYDRITRAARLVCAPADELTRHREYAKCCRTAVDAAIAKVNNPLLTAVHQNRQGGPELAALRSPAPRESIGY